ncbi:hypothetical protein LBMAG42_04970 [Deltaproteobacteria bacterium]|nr:hypothetical protein LBMAG42_04970 [Deltaproteobacteria bacterium]
MSLTILGPERPDGVLPSVLARHGVTGPIALVSAGWRYDEARDELLRAALPNEVRNLRLYDRFRHLEREETELIGKYTAKQDALRKVKDRYRLWLRTSLGMAAGLLADKPDADCPWFRQSIRHLQEADELFLSEARRLHEAFEQEVRPGENPRVRKERDEIRAELAGCAALCIAGGHIGVLRNRCFFFDLGPTLTQRPLYAWSAGAMLLTERLLLFHDHTGFGPGTAEFLDHGFGLLRNTVFLPHARERLDLTNGANLTVLASRLAPRKVMGLQNGAIFEDGRYTGAPDSAFTIRPDGSVHAAVA